MAAGNSHPDTPVRHEPRTEHGFWSNKVVVVTGGAGFLGSAIVHRLQALSTGVITIPRRREYDLRVKTHVDRLFDDVMRTANPANVVVIHAAARVGGIGANIRYPAEFFYDNLIMGTTVMHEAWHRGVGKFVALGTVCAYPKAAAIPFREDDLWDGYPEETNAPYGLAKKMLLVQGGAYRAQYGFQSIFLLPTNLYGPGDNFDPETSHVIPALIRKCVEAQRLQQPSIVAWGTGSATRDYLFVDDAANAVIMAAELYDSPIPLNVSGDGSEIVMRDLVELIRILTGYEGKVVWDSSKPDGQPRRSVDGSRARELLGFQPQVGFEEGLRRTIAWYKEQTFGT